MDKIKNQLAGVAALLGVIAAIGGGFVKYGEITTKLEALESAGGTDYSAQIAVLEEKVEALSVKHGHTKILVNEKEIELLKVQIEEIKVKSSNPLATN
jgi:ActR/RegA family two-component response regulator|tara:strand:- start:135 stop:428 length:294 start_codon:yes stop_codon:yes gene_type:complete